MEYDKVRDKGCQGTDTVLNTKLLEQKGSSFNNNYLLKIYMRSIQSLLGKHITTGYLLRYRTGGYLFHDNRSQQ